MGELRTGIFIDRDGCINKLIHGGQSGDKESYIHSKEQIEWCDGVDEAFSILHWDTEYDLFIVSNQSGIGRWGSLGRDEYDSRFNYSNIDFLFKWMRTEIDIMTCDDLREARDVIKGGFFCPHLPDAGCACRKPKPGMIHFLAVKHQIDLSRSWAIGDSESDIKAGKNAGMGSRLIMIDPDAPVIDVKEGDIVRLPRKLSEVTRVPSLLNAVRLINAYDIWIERAWSSGKEKAK